MMAKAKEKQNKKISLLALIFLFRIFTLLFSLTIIEIKSFL